MDSSVGSKYEKDCGEQTRLLPPARHETRAANLANREESRADSAVHSRNHSRADSAVHSRNLNKKC